VTNPPAYDSYVVSQGGGDKYDDDNAWVSLAFIEQYRMGLTISFDRAKQLFTFALSNWDTKASDPDPGGIFWVRQGFGAGLTNHDRGAGVNGGDAHVIAQEDLERWAEQIGSNPNVPPPAGRPRGDRASAA